MFIKTILLTPEQKRKVSEMSGKIMLWILEGRSTLYMAEQLNLSIWEVEANIDETLYTYMRQVGKRRFLRTLFRK